MTPIRIFVSSVQSEFEQERAALRNHIHEDPWIRQFFEVFLFEDAPASDRRPDALYLDEVARCDIYVGLFGLQYGSVDEAGVSPTEREFNLASERHKYRLIYLKSVSNERRDPRMTALIAKAEKEVVRKSFKNIDSLKRALSESLSEYWLNLSSHSGLLDADRCRTSAEAEEVLGRYAEAVGRTYASPEPLVPFNCRLDGGEILSHEASHLICGESANILLYGPSGCGKTHLAADIVLEFVRRGGVAVTVRVKNYTDSFETVLNREAELLAVPSAAKLLSAAQRLQRPILFVVDGYNECEGSMREFLTRELSEWARRYMANFLITSQIPLLRGDLLTFRTLEVPPAKMETKVTIVRNIMGVDVLPKEIEHLLNAVSTGLEAKLVGEVGQQLHPGSSRFALFDAYARKCLQDEAGKGIRVLSHVAAWLSDHVSFSLSVRDLGRLMDDRQAGHAILERLQSAGLLSSHGDRVSFSHEMFFNAFAAEAIVRRSASQSEAILTALASPLHAERKDFIIGAIDEQLLLERVLEGLSDQTSVAACLSGSCGSRAQAWAEARWPKLLSQLHDEVRNVRFRIDDRGFNKVAFDNESLAVWSPLDRAFLAVLPKLIVEGRYLNEILDIIGTLDTRIDEESIRLRAEARKHDIPLRSSVFAVGFSPGFGPRSPAISIICQSIHGGFFQTDGERLSVLLHEHLSGDDLSNGQLYLLLGLFHVSSFNRSTDLAGTMPSFLDRVLKTHWNQAPYHLSLALMEAAGDCYFASEADKAALIQAIESLPPPRNMWLSSSIVETLQMLGALEQSEIEHHPVVRQEVRQCLTSPNECASWEQAYRIYESQFDHPFMGAYHEIISSLPSHERKQLLMMAAKGSDKDKFFLGTLIAELASYSDPKVSESLARFTELPSTKSHSTQEAIDVFITAHIALARLGCPLPCSQAVVDSPSAESLAACGAILYWINRNDLDEGRKRKMCNPALSVLNRHRQSAALDALRLCDPRYSYRAERFPETPAVNRSIVRWFPEEIAKICRCALTQPEDLIGYFYFDERGSLVHAIDVLAQHGRNEDLSLLRRYAEDQDFGTRAIEAMKRIEQRS